MNESDEFHGQGGEYLRDPKTGKRTLVARTQPPGESPPVQTPAPAVPAPDEKE